MTSQLTTFAIPLGAIIAKITTMSPRDVTSNFALKNWKAIAKHLEGFIISRQIYFELHNRTIRTRQSKEKVITVLIFQIVL